MADAVAEGVVDAALAWDSDALVGVEVAVHRDTVFVTGRVAATKRRRLRFPIELDLEGIVREALATAGYLGRWAFSPRIETDLDVGGLDDEERAIRAFADDQSIAVGHASGGRASGFLPPAAFATRRLKEALSRLRDDNAELLGPDGKVLVLIQEEGRRFTWRRCNVALQHAEGIGYEDLHSLVLPVLAEEARQLGEILPGLGESWRSELVRVNGAGDFSCGGTRGDNGLSGKKLAVDHFGPQVPIGGGALCGKDPHKVDRVGPLAARQLAVRLVRDTGAREATVLLSFLPGHDSPDLLAAKVDGEWWDADRLRAAIAVPDLSIEGGFERLELAGVTWRKVLRRGYFGNDWPWEQ